MTTKDYRMTRVEVWPGVWLSLAPEHHLYKRISLLGDHISHEMLTILDRHKALTKQTQFLLGAWAFNVLLPAVQHYGEEVSRGCAQASRHSDKA